LSDEISQLRQRNLQLSRELSACKKAQTDLQLSAERSRAEAERFKSLHAQLQTSYQHLLSEKCELEAEQPDGKRRDGGDEEVALLKRKLQRSERENHTFRSKFQLILQEKEALKQQIQTNEAKLARLQDRIEDATPRDELKQENAHLRQTNDDQAARITELEALVETAHESVAPLEAICQRLRIELDRSTATNTELRKRMKQLEADDSEEQHSDLPGKNLQIAELRHQVLEANRESARKQAELESQMLAARARLQEATTQLQKSRQLLADAERRCERVDREALAHKRNCQELTLRVAELEAQQKCDSGDALQALRSANSQLKSDLSRLQNERETHRVQLGEFEQEKEILSAEMASLTQELAKMQDHLGMLIAEKDAAISELRRANKKQKRQLRQVQSSLDTAVDEKLSLQGELDVIRVEKEQLKATVREQQELMANAKKQIQRYEPIVGELNRQRESLQSQIDRITESRDTCERRLTELGSEKKKIVMNLESEIESFEEKVSLLEQENIEMGAEKEKLIARLSAMESELNETRDNNDHLVAQLKELSDGNESRSSSGTPSENILLDELNAVKEANQGLESENSELRKQMIAVISTSDDFAETIRRQIQSLRAENEGASDQSLPLELTEINERLCVEIERLKNKLAAYEEGTEMHTELSGCSELLGRYQKLEKRFNAMATFSDRLNQLIDASHRRNHDLENELSVLRTENLSLSEQLRKKEKSHQKLLAETERVLAQNAQVLGSIEDS
jgi:chromosome segregation ATPase